MIYSSLVSFLLYTHIRKLQLQCFILLNIGNTRPNMAKILAFFSDIGDSLVRTFRMGNAFGGPRLSPFQQKKLLHEFHTFFDLNKDGTLEWTDFEMARKQVCELSGWVVGSDRYMKTQELFRDLWRHLQDDGDTDCDGKITSEEWLKMWEQFNANSIKEVRKESQKDIEGEPADEPGLRIPEWLDRYIEYKFNLLDRAADGVIDVDEYEYSLSNFGVPAKDARSAFLMFSQGNQKKVDRKYFRELTAEFFRSDDPSSLGNFITGKLEFS